jgi:MarR family transcriptional regulator, transcriptional regulator for hemolysin
MRPPKLEPIGLDVSRTGRQLHRAFDAELAAVGGSLPVWLVLTALKRSPGRPQRDLAAAVGIDDATLTHHLRRMEAGGLVERQRDPDDRRTQRVALTAAGDALFTSLLTTVLAFDKRLRQGLSEPDVATLRDLLGRLRANIGVA